MVHPVMPFPSTDLTYRIFHIFRLPEFISSHTLIATLFDWSCFIVCILCIINPRQRVGSIVFFILYLNYFIIYNSYGTHHTHAKIAILLLPVPFMIQSLKGFVFLWHGLRYYTCFIFGSAFVWKLFRGSGFYPAQGLLIMKRNLAPYLFFNPETYLAGCYRWMLAHPAVPDILIDAGFVLEGFFLVGFFTKRFDRILFVAAIVLPFGFLFLADAFFLEITLLSLTFYFHAQIATQTTLGRGSKNPET